VLHSSQLANHHSYTGFDRDLIGRGRIRLVPVIVPEGDNGFGPKSIEAFNEVLDRLEAEGTRVRAVVSLAVLGMRLSLIKCRSSATHK
jgi:hypothetical protein